MTREWRSSLPVDHLDYGGHHVGRPVTDHMADGATVIHTMKLMTAW